MALEAGTFISDLVPSNPAATDGLSQADDHLRLLKATLLATFPNMNGAVSATDEQLSGLSAASAAQIAALAAALAAGTVMLAPPVGRVEMYAAASAPVDKLRCNGATFPFATYPALGTYLGYTSGTCTLPNFEDTGRFPRSVSALQGITLGMAQSNAFKSHTHTGTTGNESASHTHNGTTSNENAAHAHTFNVTSGGQSNGHSHPQTGAVWGGSTLSGSYVGGGGGNLGFPTAVGISIGANDQDHTHNVSGTTSSENAVHQHTFTTGASNSVHTHDFTTGATGGTETRPESLALVFYIQT